MIENILFLNSLYVYVFLSKEKEGSEEKVMLVPFTTQECWDMVLVSGMTDVAWDVFRQRMKDIKGDRFMKLFKCARTVGEWRRKEFAEIATSPINNLSLEH